MAQQSGAGTLNRLSHAGNNALQRTVNPGTLGKAQQQQGVQVTTGGGQQPAARIGRVMAKPGDVKGHVKAFQLAKKNAYEYLYGNGFEKIASRLQDRQDTPMTERIGMLSDALMREIIANARESGFVMPKEILVELNDTIVNAIVEIGVTTGAIGEMDETQEQELQMAAEMFAMREFLKNPPPDQSPSPQEIADLMRGIEGGAFDDIGGGEGEMTAAQSMPRQPTDMRQQEMQGNAQGVLGGMRNVSN